MSKQKKYKLNNISSSRKEERLSKYVEPNTIISNRLYNLVMGGTVLYGIIVNIIMYILFGDMLEGINALLFIIGYFACCIIGINMSTKSDKPVISFIGYNLVVVPIGMVLSSAIEQYGGLSSSIVLQAFLITAVISFTMIFLSILYPSFFSKIGGLLLSALIGLLVIEIVFLFLGISQIATAWISAVIFSLYIGYDYWRAQEYPKTVDNAIDSALDIYLDVINLFISILQILGKNSSSND